jgi:YHS domain-containing protein
MQWLSQNWFWIVIALGVFLMMRRGAAGCGMGGHRHYREDRDPNRAGPSRDPVNGHPVDGTRALTSIFDGQTYYFDSEESRAEFNKDPQRYAMRHTHRHHHGC